MYCTGTPSFAQSIDGIGQALGEFCKSHNFSKVDVLGFSSSGYASLLSAGCIGASSYTGFGVRTDWSKQCPCPTAAGRAAPEEDDYKTNTLTNLGLSEAMDRIGSAQLYYGASDAIDSYQAENMRGLSNFKIHPIDGSDHNVVLSLISRNRFEAVLESMDEA